jgi:hypothetical protein
MKRAIAAGEVVLTSTPLGKWVGREELIVKGLEAWTLDAIEDALGDDAARVLPDALRTAELRVRLPRFQVEMLQYFARQEATTVSGISPASSTAWPAPTPRSCRRRYRDSRRP